MLDGCTTPATVVGRSAKAWRCMWRRFTHSFTSPLINLEQGCCSPPLYHPPTQGHPSIPSIHTHSPGAQNPQHHKAPAPNQPFLPRSRYGDTGGPSCPPHKARTSRACTHHQSWDGLDWGGRGSRRLVAPPSPIAGAAMEARPARPTRRHTHPPRCRASHWITRLPPLAGHLLGCISHRVVCVASCRESTQPSCSLLSLTSPALSLPACDWTATAAR